MKAKRGDGDELCRIADGLLQKQDDEENAEIQGFLINFRIYNRTS